MRQIQQPPNVLSLKALCDVLTRERQLGKRIVTTNGCFDLMHVGHLRYLKASREKGDLLVVALNSDASVKRFKDDRRPITPEAERAEMLAALECVDYVTIFEEDTPLNVLQAIQPHVHTKGAQYTLETLPEAPALQAMGTQIAFIEMVAARSTSDIIAKVLAAYSDEKVSP